MPGSECSIWASTKKHLEPNNPNRKLNMKQEEPTSFLKGLYAKGCCRYKKIRICGGLETCPAGYFCPFINLACALLDMKQRWRPVNDTWASSARTFACHHLTEQQLTGPSGWDDLGGVQLERNWEITGEPGTRSQDFRTYSCFNQSSSTCVLDLKILHKQRGLPNV